MFSSQALCLASLTYIKILVRTLRSLILLSPPRRAIICWRPLMWYIDSIILPRISWKCQSGDLEFSDLSCAIWNILAYLKINQQQYTSNRCIIYSLRYVKSLVDPFDCSQLEIIVLPAIDNMLNYQCRIMHTSSWKTPIWDGNDPRGHENWILGFLGANRFGKRPGSRTQAHHWCSFILEQNVWRG